MSLTFFAVISSPSTSLLLRCLGAFKINSVALRVAGACVLEFESKEVLVEPAVLINDCLGECRAASFSGLLEPMYPDGFGVASLGDDTDGPEETAIGFFRGC